MIVKSLRTDVGEVVFAGIERLEGAALMGALLIAIMLTPVAALANNPAIEQASWQPYQIGHTFGFVDGYV